MYHLFQNSIWKVVKIAKTSDITLVGDTYFLPPLYIKSFIFLKGILTENSYVHSMYYGCWQFILFWGILGNSREFPDIPWTHVRCLSPPRPLSEWENCPGPRISKIFGERHYLSPKWFFPPQPEIPQNIFIKLSPSPPRPQNLGKGTSFPKFRGHGWPH